MQKTVLPNGIRVVTEQVPEAHSVTIGFWVENGSRHEITSLGGISHFIEHMLFKGTERRSALQIAKEIDSVGGVLNGFTGREYCCYYAKVLARKLPMAVDLLSDIVLHSILDPDELEKERKVILQEIKMMEDTPDDNIHDLFTRNFWHNHPLGQSVLGTPHSITTLTRDDLLRFMDESYCGRRILICAAGDLDHEEIVERIAAAFTGVAEGEAHDVATRFRPCSGVSVEEKDLEQVHLCLGTRALPQNHPDRFVSYLLNAIFGGSMSSRLFQSIREERGLAYSVYSYLNSHSDSGALVAYAGASPDDAGEILTLTLEQMRRFTREAVSEDELFAAKEQLKGNLLLSMESTDNRMTRIAKNEIYLDRHLALQEVISGIQKVTADDILRLARSLFRDETLHLQVVGRYADTDLQSRELTLN